MAKRMLRDWTDSEKVNMLSFQAEVFFIRLMMKADDYGSYHANPKLLKSMLFPLRSDSIREAEITRWMAECQKSGLIVFYNAESKPLLRIINFGQRMQNMRGKFPDPPRELTVSHGESPPEVEKEIEKEKEVEKKPISCEYLVFSLENFENEIKNSFSQIEAAARRNRTTTEKILSMIPDFIDTCKIKGKTNETWQEYCGYFSNWLLTEFSKNINKNNNQSTIKAKPFIVKELSEDEKYWDEQRKLKYEKLKNNPTPISENGIGNLIKKKIYRK